MGGKSKDGCFSFCVTWISWTFVLPWTELWEWWWWILTSYCSCGKRHHFWFVSNICIFKKIELSIIIFSLLKYIKVIYFFFLSKKVKVVGIYDNCIFLFLCWMKLFDVKVRFGFCFAEISLYFGLKVNSKNQWLHPLWKKWKEYNF